MPAAGERTAEPIRRVAEGRRFSLFKAPGGFPLHGKRFRPVRHADRVALRRRERPARNVDGMEPWKRLSIRSPLLYISDPRSFPPATTFDEARSIGMPVRASAGSHATRRVRSALPPSPTVWKIERPQH